jgi:predicted TIM-barrel fold metal-dependent hydrolase
MIVDVHVHLKDPAGEDRSDEFTAAAAHARADADPLERPDTWEAYRESAPEETIAIVFGGKARRSGIWTDDRVIADVATANPDTSVGFLSVDPTQPGWEDELRIGHQELGLRGIKIMPMYAGFDPGDPACDPLWEYAQENGLPIVSHTGTTFAPQAVLAYARPGLFDPVALRFPELRIVLAHMGHPYEGETIATFRKNRNVFADVSALTYRPFQLWHSLRLAQDYGFTHKILFGSDFNFTTVNEQIEGLRRLLEVEITGLEPLREEVVEGIIHRDSLSLLGLSR